MSTKVIAHHGSPGTPADFDELKKQLTGIDWEITNRHAKPSSGKTPDKATQLGYSFGAFHAIANAALSTENTEKVILINPYLFFKSKTTPLAKCVLSIPFIGNKILAKIAPQAIEKMLTESAAPLDVPDSYRSMQKVFSNPKILKQSLFEKENIREELIRNLEILKKNQIPICVIRGASDKTSEEVQYTELKEFTNFEEIIISDAGHALPWTHVKKLANIISDTLKSTSEKLGYYEGENANNNVVSFLKKHLKNKPEHPILTWVSPEDLKKWSFNIDDPLPHSSISVAKLDAMVGHIAAGFKKLGIKKGDRVIIFIPMSLYLYSAMFAVQKIGAFAVFLDSWARRDQMGQAAKVVDAKAFISVEQAFDYLSEAEQIGKIPLKISVGPTTKEYSARLEILMQTPEYCETEPVEKEHTALITFTTGSSGTPKGADRTHRFLAAQHYALNRHLPYKADDADLPVFPIFSLNNLAAGVTTIIPAIDVGKPAEHDPLILIAQMKSTNTTCTTLSPSLLRAVSAYCIKNQVKIPFLRRIITGGAPVSRDDLIDITSVCENAEVLVLYGSTEVEPMAHIEAKEMIAGKSSDDPDWVDEGVNVGKFDSGLAVRYLKIDKENISVSKDSDWEQLEVSEGSVGEIIVSGEHVCENYYNNKEAFFRAKIKDENGVVWHRTGDLGRKDEEGNLWLVGRVHNAIDRDGEYLFPVRAEIIIKKLPFVKDSAFLGMPDDKLGEATCAVFTSEQEASSEMIEKWKNDIKKIMDKNGVKVDKIVMAKSIPMDPRHHSKVEYALLRKTLLET